VNLFALCSTLCKRFTHIRYWAFERSTCRNVPFLHREIVLCKMQPIRNWCKIAQKLSVNQNTYKTVEPLVCRAVHILPRPKSAVAQKVGDDRNGTNQRNCQKPASAYKVVSCRVDQGSSCHPLFSMILKLSLKKKHIYPVCSFKSRREYRLVSHFDSRKKERKTNRAAETLFWPKLPFHTLQFALCLVDCFFRRKR